MALANEQGRASMARALVAVMAQSEPVRVERRQPGACSGLTITVSAVFGLGRVWPGDVDINGDRIGKGSTCTSSRLRSCRMLCLVARWSRLARRSHLGLDYDLHASSLVGVGSWIMDAPKKHILTCTGLYAAV